MKERRSEIELLRIVSMLMVLMVHVDGASLGLPAPPGSLSDALDIYDARDWWRVAVEALTITGVNCFTMISGYFGIRLRLRSMTSFLLQCVFYSVGLYLLFCGVVADAFSVGALAESFMVLTHSNLWYVPAYFMLCLLSPFLNAGCDRLSTRRLGLLTAVIVLFNIWGGWLWGGAFNPTGYTPVQLVMMYIVGRLCARFFPEGGCTRRSTVTAALVFAASTACTALAALYLPSVKAYAYNAPWTVVSSVALFVVFCGLRLRSTAVNRVAASAFAVYLIHKNPYVWGNIFKPFVVGMWSQMSPALFTLASLAFIAEVYAVCMLADMLRVAVCTPLTRGICRVARLLAGRVSA